MSEEKVIPSLDEVRAAVWMLTNAATKPWKFYGLRVVSTGQKFDIGGKPAPTTKPLPEKGEERYAAAVEFVALDDEKQLHPKIERHLKIALRLLSDYAWQNRDENERYRLLLLGSDDVEVLDEDFEIGMIDAYILGAWDLVLKPAGARR